MRCSIITIGTELLIGQVIDTNSAYLGKVLNSLGVQVASRFTIDDNREDILSALKRSLEDSDIVRYNWRSRAHKRRYYQKCIGRIPRSESVF